jgi:hypothetical protein
LQTSTHLQRRAENVSVKAATVLTLAGWLIRVALTSAADAIVVAAKPRPRASAAANVIDFICAFPPFCRWMPPDYPADATTLFRP